MDSILFVITFIIVPLFCFTLLKITKIKMLDTKIPNVFLAFYFINAYVGILPLYFYWDNYRYIMGVQDRDVIYKVLIYSSMSLIFTILGFIISNQLIGMKIKDSVKVTRGMTKITQFIVKLTFIISVGVLVMYLRKLPAIPLISSVLGVEFKELIKQRSFGGNAFQGKFHWYNLFMRQILLYLSYITFSQVIIKKERKDKILFILTFLVSSFSCLMLNEKAPIIYYFMGLILTYLISKQKKITTKSIILIGGIGTTALSFMYMFFMNMKGRSIKDLIKSIMSRLFTGSIAPAYFHLEFFPREHEFLLGRSFPNPRNIFPWEHYRLSVEIMNYMSPNLSDLGVVGSAPTVFWGEAYANFGVLGIILFSVIVGIYLYSIQHIIDNYKMVNPVIVGLQVWLVLELQNLTFGGVSTIIFNVNMVVIVSLSILLLWLDKKKIVFKRLRK